ncbi:MAG: radical SAM protein [Acidobacteriota bacterium]|nr:radical SAM protein [Acidobacteriota bacterium]
MHIQRAFSSDRDSRFLIDDFEPVSFSTWRRGELAERVDTAMRELADCRACPRDCGIDRLAGATAACHTARYARVASAFPHFGEEDCLRGRHGSGTIFFSSCNLRCVFCQNWDISQRRIGREMTAGEIADLMLELQARGCHNVNFVTPEHVAPQVVEAIADAVPRGLRLPIVYNTSAYDALSSLELLDGLIDIYMPDFKFWHSDSAKRLAKAADYPQSARQAIREMHRQVGPLRFGPDGVARRGVLVRHLVMPGALDEATKIFEWLAEEISPHTYVNVMGQYEPHYQVGETGRRGEARFSEIDRRPGVNELERVRRAARHSGLWRFA